jgi:hypothetical protein
MHKRKTPPTSSTASAPTTIPTTTKEPLTLAQELREWAFMPEGVAASFEEEARRITVLQNATNDMLDRIEQLLYSGQDILVRHKGAAANVANAVDDDSLNLQDVEALLKETRQVQREVIEPGLQDVATGLARVAVNYQTLYKKHRKFSREMICHLPLQNNLMLDRPGLGLIKNPYTAV